MPKAAVDVRPGTALLLRELRRIGPIEVAFAASVDQAGGTFVLDHFDGARTDRLDGVVSAVGDGLGGRCIAMERPVRVRDYAAARGISHQYDECVAGEGLRAIVAIPVMEAGAVREVVYGGSRRPLTLGGRLVDRMVRIVADATRPARPDTRLPILGEAAVMSLGGEEVRALHAEIRAIAGSVVEPDVRRRLARILERLSPPKPETAEVPAVALARREIDVLAIVAIGFGNIEVATMLGLTVQTVKSYLKSAMGKLDSHTRGEAVHRARCMGLLP